MSDKSRFMFGKESGSGTLPKMDDSSVNSDLTAWNKFKVLLNKSVNGGNIFDKPIQSSMVVSGNNFFGNVLSPNGDIHYVPYNTQDSLGTPHFVGNKVNIYTDTYSTYSLVYTKENAYRGGVLDSNGDIHFVPCDAVVGQKVSTDGVVSTYSLVYTIATGQSGAYSGGVLSPNGDLHFIIYAASVGQKVSKTGVVSTYSRYTGDVGAARGGVLAPDGYIYFITGGSGVTLNTTNDTFSTYPMIATQMGFSGGVLDLNGDIHMIPFSSSGDYVGQKVNYLTGVVSTYSLVHTESYGYWGGVLAPNGDVHFIPRSVAGNVIGQKVSMSGVVSTYPLSYGFYYGGVIAPNGIIYCAAGDELRMDKIYTNPAVPFSMDVCCSPLMSHF